MGKKLFGWILKAPAIFIFVISFFASIYASIKEIGGVTTLSPIFLGGMIVLYAFGEFVHLNKKDYSLTRREFLNGNGYFKLGNGAIDYKLRGEDGKY